MGIAVAVLCAEEIAALKRLVPGFIRSVEKAREEQAAYVIVSILAFAAQKEAILLQKCLQYASEQGVAVLFAPDDQQISTELN